MIRTAICVLLASINLTAAPLDLAKEMKAEGKGLQRLEHKAADGSFSFAARAKKIANVASVPTDAGPRVTARFDLGGRAPAECILTAGTDGDAAQSVANLARMVVKDMGATESNVQGIDAGVFDGTPYLKLSQIYVVKAEGGNSVGYVKVAAARAAAGLVLCVHNEVGYERTFAELFESVARSYAGKEKPAAPKSDLVYVARTGETAIGFVIQRVVAGAEGVDASMLITSMLMPAAADRVMAIEAFEGEMFGADGIVRKGNYVNAIGGEGDQEISHTVAIERTKPGEYRVSGAKQGKALQGKFKEAGLVASSEVDRRLQKSLVEGKKDEFKAAKYDPGLSPLEPIEVVYRVTRREGGKVEGTEIIGETQVEFAFEDGRFTEQRVRVGALALSLTLAYERKKD